MEENLFRYIWRYSKADQIKTLLLVLLSLPFYFLALDLPKRIVNSGISGQGFEEEGALQPFMQFSVPLGETLFGQEILVFEGFLLDQLGLLFALSFAFLGLVVVNGLFKFVINTLKGQLGERMLRRLRFQLTDRVLRFPILHMRKVRQAEIATMIKDEVEPLGGFIGEAFITPAFLGSQALTAMIFIMIQSFWLGLVAMSIVLVQAFLIPRLRKRLLTLGRERQLTARALAGRIAEIVDGSTVIQANNTSNFERAEISSRLGVIFKIRYEIYQRKFFVKFLNNFLAQVTPFIFYAGGGYLVIQGSLDIGSLVAVIAAYKDLPPPIKDLINWDQQRQDVQIKYEQVIDQFQPSGLITPELQSCDPEKGKTPLSGSVQATSLSLIDENGSKLLDGTSFEFDLTRRVAVVGAPGSGKEFLAMFLPNLIKASSGTLKIANENVEHLPASVTGQRIAYVGSDAFLFSASVRENLLYGLRNYPVSSFEPLEEEKEHHAFEQQEALKTGNSTDDPRAEWIDYAAVGMDSKYEEINRLIDVLRIVDLENDIYRFGLIGSLDSDAEPEKASSILQVRAALAEELANEGINDLVVPFDPEQYNKSATLAENLMFGTPRSKHYKDKMLIHAPIMRETLEEAGMLDSMTDRGLVIAKTMVEIFTGLPPDHPFFSQFSFIEADDLPEFSQIVKKAERLSLDGLNEDEREKLLCLPMDYIEARHRLGLVTPEAEIRVINARKIFAEKIQTKDPGAVEFYDPGRYNAAASLQDNILFGRIMYGRADAMEIVGEKLSSAIENLGLRKTVLEVGLDYHVGTAGSKLSAAQRQRLAIGRSLIKKPDLLVLNEAAAVLDSIAQEKLLVSILKAQEGRGVFWTLQRPVMAKHFDDVLVIQNGRLAESGPYPELANKGRHLPTMLAAE